MKKNDLAIIGYLILALFLVSACSASNSTINNEADGDEIEVETEDEATESEFEEEASYTIPNEAENRVVYEIHGPTKLSEPEPYNRLPFPYNFFTVEDSNSPTGLRPNIQNKPHRVVDVINTNMLDEGLFLFNDRYQDAINTLDGFSTFGFTFFEVHPDLDASLLPKTPEDSVKDDSLIMLVQLEDGNPAFGKRIPVWVTYEEAVEFGESGEEDKHLYWFVAIRPANPLDPQTRYCVVVKKGLKSSKGEELEPSVHFKVIKGEEEASTNWKTYYLFQGEQKRMEEVFTLLASDPIKVDKSNILLAYDYTTQSAHDTLFTMSEWIADETVTNHPPNFDVDNDGKPDVFTVDTYPGNFPNAKVDGTHVGAVLHGIMTSADLRLPRTVEDRPNFNNAIDYNDKNEPIIQKDGEVPFVLYLPKLPEKDAKPFPVVIAQHGINSRKEHMKSLAPEFAEKGWATLLMDFPYHGERCPGCFSPLEFIDIPFPLKSRASFIQAAIDHMQIAHMLSTWNLDIYPAGNPDGILDIDKDRIAFVGTSLGGIVGATSLAVSKELDAAVINVGGGGLLDFVAQFLKDYGLGDFFPNQVLLQFAMAAQTVLDAGDGINFARFYNDTPEGFNTKYAIIQESIDDDTVPNPVSENLAKAGSFPHLKPVERDVYGLDVIDPPYDNLGFIQFHPAIHGTIFNGTHLDSHLRVREQIRHFIETYFETGKAEIIVPEKKDTK